MKKRILLGVLIAIFGMFISTTVEASELLAVCKYYYFSVAYGYTSAQVKLYQNPDELGDALYIDRFNNTTRDSGNQNLTKTDMFWNNFINSKTDTTKRYICPYYLVVYDPPGALRDTRGAMSYTKSELEDYLDDLWTEVYWTVDSNEDHFKSYTHLLVSDTIEEDFPNYDKDAQGDNTTYQGVPMYQSGGNNPEYHCIYNTGTLGIGSAVVDVYSDGTYYSRVLMFNSKFETQSFASGNWVYTMDNWDNAYSEMKKRKQCPYYLGVDFDNQNQMMPSFDLATIKNHKNYGMDADTHILYSITLPEDKKAYDGSYDEKVDGKPLLEKDAAGKAWQGQGDGGPGDYDPKDPFGMHIGDNFCSEEKVVKTLKALGNILTIAKLVIPILIIIMGTWDFFKAVTGADESGKTLKKKTTTLLYRIGAGVFIFFIPTLTNAFFNGLVYYKVISDDVNQCQNCLLNPNDPRYCEIWASSAGSTPVVQIQTNETLNTKPGVSVGTLSPGGPSVSVDPINPGGVQVTAEPLNGANDISTNGNSPVDNGTKNGSCSNKTVFSKLSYDAASKGLSDALAAATNGREKAVAAANFLGTNFPNLPYWWGGYTKNGIDSNWGSCKKVEADGHRTSGTKVPWGMDCSGFVSWVMKQAGYKDGHQLSGYWGYIVKEKKDIREKDSKYLESIGVKVGDLVWHDGHIGIIAGKNEKGYIVVHEKGFDYGLSKEYLDTQIYPNGSKFTHVLLMDKYYNK